MDEIRDAIEDTLALAGYEIIDSNGNIVWVYDKKHDIHYSIIIKD